MTEKFKVVVSVNKEEGTLTFSDNGIGMTDEEVKKYITQVAFSGAEDFYKSIKIKWVKEMTLLVILD